jgi:hypothetical protein
MLYDQGQLVNVYLDAFSITNDVFYSSLSRDILDYLRRDMIGPEGEIFSAEDADSAEREDAKKKKEGAFYIWTSQEVSYHHHFGLHFILIGLISHHVKSSSTSVNSLICQLHLELLSTASGTYINCILIVLN